MRTLLDADAEREIVARVDEEFPVVDPDDESR
jgi:hypothetical protein